MRKLHGKQENDSLKQHSIMETRYQERPVRREKYAHNYW